MESFITAFLTFIIISFCLKPSKNNNLENDQIISFEYPKKFVKLLLVCTIVSFIISLALAFVYFKGDCSFGNVLFFFIFSIICALCYSLFNKSKIIYKDKQFICYGFTNKPKIYNQEDIEKVIRYENYGLKIYFKNNKKISFDNWMTNYDKLDDLLP